MKEKEEKDYFPLILLIPLTGLIIRIILDCIK
jgi:hypothetical protein